MTTQLAYPCSALPDRATWSINQRARLATLTCFFVQGAVFSTWVSRIPVVQDRLRLSNSKLGLALLAISAAGMISMPITGIVAAKLGTRRIIRAAIMVYCLTLLLPVLAGNFIQLVGALVLLGTLFGAMNVSINAQAVLVERAYARPIMSSFHALFSLGGMAGAAMGGVMAALGVSMIAHFLATIVLLSTAAMLTTPWLLAEPKATSDTPSNDASPPRRAWGNRTLLLLGTVAFCVLVGEGAMADWTAVYLHRGLGTGTGLAAAGYAAFSLAMTTGRLAADRITARLGPRRFVRLGGTLAALGLATGLLSHRPALAIVGFACAGAGFSGIVPILFSAGGRLMAPRASVGIAAVSTMGFAGFLLGPPVIGFVADAASLTWGLGVVVLTSAVAALLAGNVEAARTPQPSIIPPVLDTCAG